MYKRQQTKKQFKTYFYLEKIQNKLIAIKTNNNTKKKKSVNTKF